MAVTISGLGTVTGLATGGLPDGSISADDLASSAVTQSKIASGAVGRSQLQYTYPTEVITTINPSGLTEFGFSVSAYPQYLVYWENIGGSVGSANVSLRASYDGGSSFVSNFTYRGKHFYVNGTDDNTYGSTAAGGWIWVDIWNGAAPSGTHGQIMIAGTSYYASNKRLTYSAHMAGQTQGNQGTQIHMGQTQDDSHSYNYVKFVLSSGTFYGNSRVVVCGVKAL